MSVVHNQTPASVAHHRSIGKKILLKYWRLYVLLLPALLYIVVFNYGPMYGVQIAFKKFSTSKGIWGSPWVGFDQFVKLFNLPIFGTLLRNTLVITIYSLLTFPIPILFALMLNELRSQKLKKSVQMISYAPHFISTVVLCSMIILFLDVQTGMINKFITALGGTARPFMQEASAFPSIVVWSDVWQNTGWSSIIYLAALSGVSLELIEAARIDGANRMRIIWHINIPSIMPTMVILLIMRCGNLLNLGFEKIFLLQNPLNLDTSRVISTYVYEIGLKGNQYSFSTAIGLFNNVINLTILTLVNSVFKRLTETSMW